MDAMFSSLNPDFPAATALQEGDWVPMVRGGSPGREMVFKLPASRVQPIAVYKTAMQGVTNSTTLVNDDQLFLAVKANRRYVLGGRSLGHAHTCSGIRVAWCFPAVEGGH